MLKAIATALSVLASIITIALFIASADQYIGLSTSSQTPTIDSPLVDENYPPPSPAWEATGSYRDRIRELGRGAAGFAGAVLAVLWSLGKVLVVLFAPWLPAFLAYRFVTAIRYHLFGAWLWIDVSDTVWPIASSLIVYFIGLMLAIAVVFPSFFVSEWVWNWVAYWAAYPKG